MSTPRLYAVPVPRRAPLRAEEPRDLCVVLACHQLVCAVPARWIERLVRPEEVASIAAPASPDRHRPPLVLVGERHFAGYNLGTLLGLAPLDGAWLLMRVPHKQDEIPIALHTGTCLVVQHLAPGVAFPGGVFRARAGAIVSAFPARSIKGRVAAEIAFWLDPARLWSDDELAGAAAALEAVK